MKFLMMFFIAINIYAGKINGWSSYKSIDKKSITYTYGELNKDAFHLRKYNDGTWLFHVGSTEKLKNVSVILTMSNGDIPVILNDVYSKTKNDVYFRVDEETINRIKDIFFDAETFQEVATFQIYNGSKYTEVLIDCKGFKNMYRKMYN